MTKRRRMQVEALSPPLIASIILIAFDRSDTWVMMLVGFPAVLIFVYPIGIVPSLIYMFAMEMWFKLGLHARLGLLCTVAWSGLLGSIAGFSCSVLGMFLRLSPATAGPRLALYGVLTGLAIGFYVGRQPKSAA